MVIVRSIIAVALTSPKPEENWSDYPLLTQKGIDIIKHYSEPRTATGSGLYASYREYGEDIWRIGYGSKRIGRYLVGSKDTATRDQIEKQLIEDLKQFSRAIEAYIYVPLNKNKKAAILSFAYSIGLCSFKSCRLLDLVNRHATKTEIIREWSPYINQIWFSGGERIVNQRRVELNTFYAADKEIPTFTPHKCKLEYCLLNLTETYHGAYTQIRAIEYLENKITQWDPSGRTMKYFFRLWSETPSGLGSPQRLETDE